MDEKEKELYRDRKLKIEILFYTCMGIVIAVAIICLFAGIVSSV